jgi:hypothetical protein
MAQGKWVNIPGKGRRWQQPSGELMMEKPGIGFVQAQLSPVTGFLGSIFKSSGLPAYQMSGPGLQQLRQQQTQDYYRQRGLSSLGPEYKEQELAAGQAAENFRPGAGFPGQQAERAYQQEKSRVEQLTKQDPELKRYQDAREAAKTQEEMNAARDIGMAIWAAKHGGPDGLASKVKPGQSGYEAIQRTLYPGGTPASALPAESEAMLNAIAPTNEFGVRPNVTPMPGQLPSFGSNTEAMFNAITGGGSLVTPMPQQFVATTPQDQAQGLAETYKKALLGDLGNDPLGIAGIYRYGR